MIFFYNLCLSLKPFSCGQITLVSLVFYEMPGPESGTWIPDLDLNVCSLFLAVNIMISWFVLMLELSARLQKTLENQSANLQANFGLEGIISKHFFCSEKGFKVGNALSLLTVNCKRSLPTLSREFWHVTTPNRHAHVRITPIVRCIRNP